jgi:hypothetical protein
MKKYSIDVLVYMDSVKQFFEKNKEAKEYFLLNTDEDVFFEKLCDMSEKNMNNFGIPNLTVDQFEELREKITRSIIIFISNYGSYSLN